MTFISYAQNYEDVMLYRALKRVEKGFYIDVGANDPVLNSVTKAFYERGWRGINIEPVRYWYDKLAADRPEDVNLNIAISDKPGLVRLYDVVHTGLSTFSQEVAEEHKKTGGFAYQEISVQAMTLDEVLATSSYDEIQFLNIDVEGAEGQVLAGTDLNRIRPWIILVESTKPLSSEQNFENWDSLLTRRGYAFVYFDGLNRFYLAKERGELRVAFDTPPNVFDDFIRVSESNNLSLLNTKEVERQQLEAALNAREAERQQLEVALNAKEVERQQVETALNAREAERQQLEATLNAKEAERQQLEAALNLKEAENQQLEAALNLKEAERQQTEAALDLKDAEHRRLGAALNLNEAERQRLGAALNLNEAERQRLEAALNLNEAERQRLEAALNSSETGRRKLESALDSSRRYQTELELRFHMLENEVKSVRSEAHHWWTESDHWWREADQHWTALQAVYASKSWKLTAPMRALHIKENIKKFILAVFAFMLKVPLAGSLLHLIKIRFPKVWHTVATRVKNTVTVEPSAPAPAQLPVVAVGAPKDEQHFLDLFQRELSRRAAEKTEARQ